MLGWIKEKPSHTVSKWSMVAKIDCQCHLSMPEMDIVHSCYVIVDKAKKFWDRLGFEKVISDRYCVQQTFVYCFLNLTKFSCHWV